MRKPKLRNQSNSLTRTVLIGLGILVGVALLLGTLTVLFP